MTQHTAPAPSAKKRKVSPLAVTIIGVVVLVLLFIWFASIWAEVLWFDQLGYVNVLVTQWIARGIMFVIGFVMMAVPLYFAIDISHRTRPVYAKLSSQLDRYQEVIEPLRKLLTWGVPVVFGLFAGLAASAWWQPVLLWWNSEPTGEVDPQFGLDLSFYLFDLALWQGVVGFASAVTLIALIATAATSYLYGGIAFTGKEVRISKATRIQAGILATLYVALQAVSLWLDQYSTLSDSRGLVTGALFKDVNAVIPAKQILAGIALIVALLFLFAAITGKWRMPVVGTALLLVASLVVGAGYPWMIQEFKVSPDEKILEAEYVQRNIDATRAAFDLEDVKVERYEAVTDAEPGALRNDAQTTANIRIMDPEIISPTFAQLEQIRQYYKFPKKLTVDRYEIDGKIEDTVAAVRDIDVENQSGWVNQTLVYTHGYGMVAAYGNQRSVDGQPVFLESGIPTEGRLGEFEPRVYFGVNSPKYSIVGGEREKDIEIDYPADDTEPGKIEVPSTEEPAEAPADEADGADPKAEDGAEEPKEEATEEPDLPADAGPQNMTTFSGDGGPVLGGLFEKIVYALKFQDIEILLSGSVASGSQILFDRDPVERVQKVAPYLTTDSTPYTSVVDGRIVWIIDGYTTSSNYPYAELVNMTDAIVDADHPSQNQPNGMGVNYIRNSVKATVDAYDGSVTLYAWDDKDPILDSWSKIFPTTVKNVSEMSGDLMSHVRYPSDLFKVQRQVLGKYHVTESGAFYSNEDAWRTPNNPVKGKTAGVDASSLPQPPYYLTLAAGKDVDPEFSIYSTYIPDQRGEGSRDILTGYLAANSNAGNVDGEVSEGYGTLKLLTLPKGNTVPGPGQVQNSFTTDPEVTSLLNMLRLGESDVISGNLLTLPVGGGLLYVQPVYVKATTGTSYPLLQKVLVSFGDEIAFEDTLDAALDKLFGGDSGASAGDNQLTDEDGNPVDPEDIESVEPGDEGTEGEGSAKPKPDTSPESLQKALKDMQEAITEREAAMQAGDWAAYGKADEKLTKALEQALKLSE
ncbi:UPF0182 family protein [Leucobacter sp. UCMA 4100]|uniref:UPF0182 family membrane protein n=1 Tax=Leucobacter sp. UCMA 4100 TaxID=2810534 RepID=UPI0022EA5721|nr:UPF0182 family protein [Leucobacter sp. UCMA 4100]MDA3146051.1 UPF0182 family protein [Leucobacter sp. UCMA 4100]